jgi:hypothetical protein
LIDYIVVGRILIWALQNTPLLDGARRHPKVQELLNCDFCLGVWVFSILAIWFKPGIIPKKLPWSVQCAATGLVVSFATHLARIGWEVRFGNAIHSS